MGTRNVARAVGRGVACLAWALVAPVPLGAQPPARADAPEEPARLAEAIEKAVAWYDVLPEEGATPLTPVAALRWRNVARGQDGEAMLVVWPHNGRPVAMASIYPWDKKIYHEFDSLSRGGKLSARDGGRVVWSPDEAGVEFRDVPKAPRPAKSPADRLRQMKAVAEGFQAKMTGWQADSSDQEALRLLPRPLYRYDFAGVKDPDPKLLDGALFAYVLGTDPEVVLVLEAVGPAGQAIWQYGFARATSGGLEVKSGDAVVWSARRYPAHSVATLPHFTAQRALAK